MIEPRCTACRRRPAREQGQAMVEFAITSVIIFLLLMFIVDGGRILWQYVTVAEAASSGARYASLHGARSGSTGHGMIGPGDDDAMKTYILGSVTGLGSSGLAVHLDYLNHSNAVGSQVTVYVTYTVTSFTRIIWPNQQVRLADNVTTPILN
jgi:Flp pilus assembly protein TadG